MKGFIINIDKDTLENENYRRVLYTANHTQLVLMCIKPGDEIGEETHKLDQFIRFELGTGVVVMDGVKHKVEEDIAVIIPAGVTHNVINTGDIDLKLYSLYSPPEHKDGTVHKTKAEAVEGHFDGITKE